MKKFLRQIEQAAIILNEYGGKEPFHLYLSHYFRKHKNYGSTDRKFYKNACYAFWRFSEIGRKANTENILESLVRSDLYREEIKASGLINDAENLNNAKSGFWVTDKFKAWFDEELDVQKYQRWFESTAPVYLVAAKGKENILLELLQKNGLPFSGNTILKTSHSPFIADWIQNGICRLQDKGTAQSLAGYKLEGNIWDCCCGAGGKSILVSETNPAVQLYSSDKRAAIVENLQKRYQTLGLQRPHVAEFELSGSHKLLQFDGDIIPQNFFDTIIADVPCSGSGTWRHNPDAAHFFDVDSIESYSNKQRDIIANALPYLKSGGLLFYITCSVFAAENDKNVRTLEEALSLTRLSSDYTGGADEDCDYIYRAVLKKN